MTADEVAADAVELDNEAYRAWVAGLELVRVDTIHVRATRSGPGDAAGVETDLDSSFAIDAAQGAVFYKYDVGARIVDADETSIGEVEATLVLVFEASSTDVPVAMVDHFGGTSAFMMVRPYLRETVGGLAARIGFAGVILPIARR